MGKPISLSEKWTPTPEISSHSGEQISQDCLFFCQPPNKIGKVISAHSIAKAGKTFGWLSPSKFECSFIGEKGWARESIDSHLQVQKNHLVFEDCHDLIFDLYYYYSSGRDKGIHFHLKWIDANGNGVGKIDDIDFVPNTPSDISLQFALAAEKSWTKYLVPIKETELQTNGAIVFPIKSKYFKGDYAIRLIGDEVFVRYEDTNMQFNITELEPVEVFHENFGTGGKHECFMIRKKDIEKHVWGKTTVTIEISEVANRRLLIEFLNKEKTNPTFSLPGFVKGY